VLRLTAFFFTKNILTVGIEILFYGRHQTPSVKIKEKISKKKEKTIIQTPHGSSSSSGLPVTFNFIMVIEGHRKIVKHGIETVERQRYLMTCWIKGFPSLDVGPHPRRCLTHRDNNFSIDYHLIIGQETVNRKKKKLGVIPTPPPPAPPLPGKII
jgi:hypothetical protein